MSELQFPVLILAPTTILLGPTHVVTVLIPISMDPTKTLPYVLQDFVGLITRLRAMNWKDRINQEEWSYKLLKLFEFGKIWDMFRSTKLCILNLHVRGPKHDKLLSWFMKKYFGLNKDDLFRI